MSYLAIIKSLQPDINRLYQKRSIDSMVGIAEVIADADGIEDKYKELGVALLTLDLLNAPDRDDVVSQSIARVSESYSGKGRLSKWRKYYNSLLTGVMDSSLALYYVGI